MSVKTASTLKMEPTTVSGHGASSMVMTLMTFYFYGLAPGLSLGVTVFYGLPMLTHVYLYLPGLQVAL